MLISTKGRYALRVMLELAQGEPGECMPLPVIAQRQGISEKYLESIIAVLARAGLVEGQRGKGGGYRLSRELKDYSVGEIVRLTEGSLAPVSCLEERTPARARTSVSRCPSGRSSTRSSTTISTAFRSPTCWPRAAGTAAASEPRRSLPESNTVNKRSAARMSGAPALFGCALSGRCRRP